IPTVPPITVNITAVNNQQALDQAVAEALAATDQANAHITETVIANHGMTLTPSTTPTITPTSTATATRRVTATLTPQPTETLTPTYIPLLTTTPAAVNNPTYGWLRFVNRWVAANGQAASAAVDVFVNEDRIASGITFGNETNYYQVTPGAIRVSLRLADQTADASRANVPIVTTIVDVTPGGVVSVLAMDLGTGMNLYPIPEDSSPLAVGTSRLTLIQANPGLLAVNVDIADKGLRLASNLSVGNIIGPLDVPAGHYSIDLNDARATNVSTVTSVSTNLTGQVSNFLILLPPSVIGSGAVTTSDQWTGLTGRVKNDIGVSFINALNNVGNIQIAVGQSVIDNLAVGQVSPSLPVPLLGAPFVISTGGEAPVQIDSDVLGPYTEDANNTSDKMILLVPNAKDSTKTALLPVTFSQNAPRSAINANIRFVHGLAGAVPLNLQIRPLRGPTTDASGQPQAAPAWATVGQAEFGTASAYSTRNPDTYAVRVVQSGSQTVLAELPAQQFLAGGIYDFVVVPGSQTGSAQLLMVEPTIQITQLVQGSGNPTAVYEAVSSTLTALAPAQVAVTVTKTATPTPTRTPIPTNTPRPTNTPEFRLPLLVVNPAPPDTTSGTISLVGENFQPKLQYAITLDEGSTSILTGQVNDDGTLLESIPLPENLLPGIHSLRVCVDCRPRGLQQAAYAQFIVADPRVTPTATAQP
ncbi:MAG: DUF4397 domain-containing protein, partial [Chloroflexota bacterium]